MTVVLLYFQADEAPLLDLLAVKKYGLPTLAYTQQGLCIVHIIGVRSYALTASSLGFIDEYRCTVVRLVAHDEIETARIKTSLLDGL